MRVAAWWCGWGALVLLRLVLLVKFATGPLNVVSGALVVSEGVALLLGVVNAFVAVQRDTRWVGLLCPLSYAAGVFLLPTRPLAGLLPAVMALGGLLLTVTALAYLGVRFSVAGASWVKLCDRGPYRWVRHPQQLGRFLIVSAIGFGCVDLGEVARVAVAQLLVVVVVITEEGLLLSVREWREYAQRVRWRLVPGMF